MDISKYIAAFLTEKGHLNLPGFGYFTSEYRPAAADEKTGILSPPGRTYTFTPGNRHDDEGLSLFIAGKENTPVTMARKEIEEYVDGCHYVMGRGKRLEIPGIGMIWKDEQGIFRFEQEKQLADEGDWYGLPALRLKPVKSAVHYRTVKIIMALFIVAGLVLGGFYAGMIGDLLKEKFGKSPLPMADTVISGSDTAATAIADSLVPATGDSLALPGAAAGPQEPEPAMTGPEKTVMAATPSHAPGEAGYYIVAGCFRLREGAEKTVKMLKQQGFDAALFGQDRQGLHLVSYAYYPGRKEAVVRLGEIRKANPDAWLLKFP